MTIYQKNILQLEDVYLNKNKNTKWFDFSYLYIFDSEEFGNILKTKFNADQIDNLWFYVYTSNRVQNQKKIPTQDELNKLNECFKIYIDKYKDPEILKEMKERKELDATTLRDEIYEPVVHINGKLISDWHYTFEKTPDKVRHEYEGVEVDLFILTFGDDLIGKDFEIDISWYKNGRLETREVFFAFSAQTCVLKFSEDTLLSLPNKSVAVKYRKTFKESVETYKVNRLWDDR